MSEISVESLRRTAGSDGAKLGGYGIYVSQLIYHLTSREITYKEIIAQVLIFGALILLREYKKRNPGVDAGAQNQEPISE